MAKYVGVVYDPPASGFPFLAVLYDERDMTRVVVSQPVQTLADGEAVLAELAKGLVEMAKRDGYA